MLNLIKLFNASKVHQDQIVAGFFDCFQKLAAILPIDRIWREDLCQIWEKLPDVDKSLQTANYIISLFDEIENQACNLQELRHELIETLQTSFVTDLATTIKHVNDCTGVDILLRASFIKILSQVAEKNKHEMALCFQKIFQVIEDLPDFKRIANLWQNLPPEDKTLENATAFSILLHPASSQAVNSPSQRLQRSNLLEALEAVVPKDLIQTMNVVTSHAANDTNLKLNLTKILNKSYSDDTDALIASFFQLFSQFNDEDAKAKLCTLWKELPEEHKTLDTIKNIAKLFSEKESTEACFFFLSFHKFLVEKRKNVTHAEQNIAAFLELLMQLIQVKDTIDLRYHVMKMAYAILLTRPFDNGQYNKSVQCLQRLLAKPPENAELIILSWALETITYSILF